MTQTITNISVDVLKVHPRNNEFFDDIGGEEYLRFKKSIEDDGLLSPLIVAPDMTVISGHQRLKACKELGYKSVPVIIKDDLDDEDEKLKKLIAANFGRLKNDPVKQGKLIKEYERLEGIKRGGAKRQFVALKQEDIAKELGVDVKTLQRLKRLAELPQEFQELITSGNMTPSTGYLLVSKLTEEEQMQLLRQLPAVAKLTQSQVQTEVDKIKGQYEEELDDANERLKEAQSLMLPQDQDYDAVVEERDKYKDESRKWYEETAQERKARADAERKLKAKEQEATDLARRLEKAATKPETKEVVKQVEVIPDEYIKAMEDLKKTKEELKQLKFIEENRVEIPGLQKSKGMPEFLHILEDFFFGIGAYQYVDMSTADQADINQAIDFMENIQGTLKNIHKKLEVKVA
jgi:ParB family chromosome partitioning protein